MLSVIKHLVLGQITITSSWRTHPKLLTLHQHHLGPGFPWPVSLYWMSSYRKQKVSQLGLGFQPWKRMNGSVKNMYNILTSHFAPGQLIYFTLGYGMKTVSGYWPSPYHVYSILWTSESLNWAYATNLPFGDHHRAKLVENISSTEKPEMLG